MQKITSFLWFEHKAEEAARFYVSLFKNSSIVSIDHMGKGVPGPKEGTYIVSFTLSGQKFLAINGGPNPGFKFSPAISLLVNCKTQREIDFLWSNLTKEGKPNVCGWLTDKYGITWQITPAILPKLMSGKNPVKVKRVTEAFMKMVKFDIKKLKVAYAGK